MTHMSKAHREAIWSTVLPALERAWAAYEQLHGIPAAVWPGQERALFDLNPKLYIDFHLGETPAMARGAARVELERRLSEYWKQWGAKVALYDMDRFICRTAVPKEPVE